MRRPSQVGSVSSASLFVDACSPSSSSRYRIARPVIGQHWSLTSQVVHLQEIRVPTSPQAVLVHSESTLSHAEIWDNLPLPVSLRSESSLPSFSMSAFFSTPQASFARNESMLRNLQAGQQTSLARDESMLRSNFRSGTTQVSFNHHEALLPSLPPCKPQGSFSGNEGMPWTSPEP